MCSSAFSAQMGNEYIDAVMETKLLDFNLDKSCYLVIGDNKSQAILKSDLSVNPLKLSVKHKLLTNKVKVKKNG